MESRARADRRRPAVRHALRLASLFVLLVGTTATSGANVYYVDNQNLAASATGPGSRDLPYPTISAALAARQSAGTVIVVRPGVYRERVVVPASGLPSMPIVIRTEGGSVVLDGADDFSLPGQWTPFAGSVWRAASVNWAPAQVFADGARLTASAQPPAALEPGAFGYVPGSGLFVNVGGDNPASHAAAVGRRTHGFLVNGKSNLFIDGFQIVRAEQKGIEIVGSNRVIVRYNVVRQSGSGGISAEASTDVQVFANQVSDNNHHGILFRAGVTGSRIDDNESFGNTHAGEPWATGIYLAGSPGNLVECNRVHDNQDSGIEVQSGSNDSIVRNNLSWSNGDHGYAMLYVTGTQQLGNVAWANTRDAFSVQGSSTGTRIFNCIAQNRGTNFGTYALMVDSSSTAGFDGDFNILWIPLGSPPVRFGKTTYGSVAAYQSATGSGFNTLSADPRFVDPTAGDFHLRADSPAIDAASSALEHWPETDAEGRNRADAPGTPNTGVGPVSYADRGALEFQGGVLAVGGRTTGRGLALSPAFPNPSRRSVAFSLELPTTSDVSWTVCDVLGREIWSERSTMAPGRNELRWALTNRSGSLVPNGVYLVRVSRRGESSTMRFVVMH